jgi:hypothetical protein
MGRFRTGAFSGVLLFGACAAFTTANCAPPTQIIVDVETDDALCGTIVVGIAVAKPEEIDTKDMQVRQAGCEINTDRVGTLTITPSGAHDAEVGLRIVAGVNGTTPEQCGRPDANGKVSWNNCIVARRTVQFVPGKTTPLTVVLSSDCVGQLCADGKECNLGKCVPPSQVQPDGGNEPLKDGQSPYPDATSDGSVDAAVDACVFCKGPPGTATCSGTTNSCLVDCSGGNCGDNVVCGGGLDCTINCFSGDSCKRTRCVTSGACTFNCTGPAGQHCTDIECHAGTCFANCDTAENTCVGMLLEAGTSSLTCAPTPGNKPTCNDVTCVGGTCSRSCGPDGVGCGDKSTCIGTCTDWQDAGDGGGP